MIEGLSLPDIEAAAARLEGVAVKTPVVTNPALDERVDARIYLKAENLQRTGSFKFRGAYNRLAQLAVKERKAGVVAWSSGNHAQGVAAAAQLLSIPATIVMPTDAPKVKTENTLAFGADVFGYDRYSEDREEIARSLCAARGCTLVPSYDDWAIMAGQGTAGLELVQQAPALDYLLICCGGGGLAAGISTVFKALSPDTKIYTAEPAAFNDYERSLRSGKRVANEPGAVSICDALLTPTPGEKTYSINRHGVSGGVSVTDDEVKTAMRFAYETLKLVIEPGGAVALAAALAGKLDLTGQAVGVIVSGGNVDAQMFADVIMADR